jgi:hypothetical protein
VQVLVLLRELLEPLRLLAAGQPCFEPLDEANVVLRVPALELHRLAGVCQLRRGELADRLEQAETSLGLAHEVLVDERSENVELRVADGLGRVQREPAGEEGEPCEELPLRVVEQVVAPLDRGLERPLALRRVARAGGQERKSAVEAGKQRGRAEELRARGRELDRERQAVEPSADLRDLRAVRGRAPRCRSFLEQLDSRRLGQWLQEVFDLRADTQGLAARREDHGATTQVRQRRQLGRGRGDLLEVVEDKQRASVPEVILERSGHG